VLYPTLRENADGSAGTEVESLCMNCHKQGVTRILLTDIPFFRQVVIMAFECEHCGYRSSDVQPGGQIAESGVQITVKVDVEADLQRSVLLSDAASVSIPQVELDIPSSRRGRLTTVEGIITEVIDNLNLNIAELRERDPESAEKITVFVAKLANLKTGLTPFIVLIKDPSGNSAVEGLQPGKKDSKVFLQKYRRSREENLALGLQVPEADAEGGDGGGAEAETSTGEPRPSNEADGERDARETNEDKEAADVNLAQEVMVLPEDCPSCGRRGENRMKVQSIPFFKEVVLMAFTCDYCGYKSNEVKPSGQISDKGRKTILNVTMAEDLSRDLLKSNTAILDIPEIDLTLETGTLGSVFTTIEGLLLKTKEALMQANPFALGDSASGEQKERFRRFFESMDRLLAGGEKFTVILDDPAGNSFIQNIYAPDPDPEMTVQEYERDEEQDEELGLTHAAM